MENILNKEEKSSLKIVTSLFEENLNEQFDLIKTMKRIKCTIFDTGLKPERQFYYNCSCDPNKIYSICEECSKTCHKNHVLSERLEGNIICACGFKGHLISSENKNSNGYDKNCVFNEFEKISGRLIYYLTPDNKKLCMFCNTFCHNKEKMNINNNNNNYINNFKNIIYLDFSLSDETSEKTENKKVYLNLNKNEILKKENFEEIKNQLPDCECKHENHFNLKNILDITNFLGIKRINFEDLNSNQLLNLIFISNVIYKNNYSLFEEYANKGFNFKDGKFQLDTKIVMTSYLYSIMNFHNISKSFTKKLRYPNSKITNIFDYNLISNLLVINLENNSSTWAFFNHILGIFRKCWLGKKLSKMSKFKINDLENLSVLQRLCFIKVKYSTGKNILFSDFLMNFIYNQDNNIINLLLKYIENVTRIGFTSVEGLEMYLTVISIILRLSNYYLIKDFQKIRFVNLIENTLKHLNTIMFTFRDSEKFRYIKYIILKLLLKITKTFIYMAYEENDSIIFNEIFQEKEFLNEKKIKNLDLFHMNNEFGIIVSKVFIETLSLTQQEFDQFTNENKDFKFRIKLNNLLRYQNHLLALFFKSNDSYMIGLRSSFIGSKIYVDFLSDPSFEENSNNFGFNSAISSLENVYYEYMNFSSDKENMNNLVLYFIKNFITNYRDLITLGKSNKF
jgi:hypothetical protein